MPISSLTSTKLKGNNFKLRIYHRKKKDQSFIVVPDFLYIILFIMIDNNILFTCQKLLFFLQKL